MDGNRRTFLKSTAATVATAWISRSSCAGAAENKAHAIRLGGPLFNPPGDPEAIALAHRKSRYRAAYCPHVNLTDRERIRDIHNAFAKHDVLLAEVGRWCNLMDADASKRSANLQTVTEGLSLPRLSRAAMPTSITPQWQHLRLHRRRSDASCGRTPCEAAKSCPRTREIWQQHHACGAPATSTWRSADRGLAGPSASP